MLYNEWVLRALVSANINTLLMKIQLSVTHNHQIFHRKSLGKLKHN